MVVVSRWRDSGGAHCKRCQLPRLRRILHAFSREAIMHTRKLFAVLALVAASVATHPGAVRAQAVSQSDVPAQARVLFDEYWQWTLREYPEFATYVGDHRYDDRLSDQSAAALAKRNAARAEFLRR